MEERVLYFINAHYMDPISLDDVADSIGISKYYLSRNFKKLTTYSFCDYLNRKRVAAAVEMLLCTDTNITQIAMLSGFQSISSFNRVFHQVMGCSPKEFRAA